MTAEQELAVPRTMPGTTGFVEVAASGHDSSSVQAAVNAVLATSGCRTVVPSTPDASDASSATVQVSGPTKDAVNSVIARISALAVASGAGGDTGRGQGASSSSADVSVPGSHGAPD